MRVAVHVKHQQAWVERVKDDSTCVLQRNMSANVFWCIPLMFYVWRRAPDSSHARQLHVQVDPGTQLCTIGRHRAAGSVWAMCTATGPTGRMGLMKMWGDEVWNVPVFVCEGKKRYSLSWYQYTARLSQRRHSLNFHWFKFFQTSSQWAAFVLGEAFNIQGCGFFHRHGDFKHLREAHEAKKSLLHLWATNYKM